MARIRNIKQSLFTNEDLADCPPLARLLFAGLPTIADREGRLPDRPRKIKVELLPFDDCDIDAYLSLLQEKKFITRYTVDGEKYIQINKFSKHQNPHKREAPSEIPPVPASQGDDKHSESPEKAETLPGKGDDEPGGTWVMGNGKWEMGDGDEAGPDLPPEKRNGSPPVVNPLVVAFGKVCQLNLSSLRRTSVEKLSEAMDELRRMLRQPDEVIAARLQRFGEFFETLKFTNPVPYPSQVPGEWLKFEQWERRQNQHKAKTESPPIDSEISQSLGRLKQQQQARK